jgi:hypothetical protein
MRIISPYGSATDNDEEHTTAPECDPCFREHKKRPFDEGRFDFIPLTARLQFVQHSEQQHVIARIEAETAILYYACQAAVITEL